MLDRFRLDLGFDSFSFQVFGFSMKMFVFGFLSLFFNICVHSVFFLLGGGGGLIWKTNFAVDSPPISSFIDNFFLFVLSLELEHWPFKFFFLTLWAFNFGRYLDSDWFLKVIIVMYRHIHKLKSYIFSKKKKNHNNY